MHGEVSARPELLPEDGGFLLALYATVRKPELTGLGWSAAEQEAFIRMQFDAQIRHYRGCYPDARYSVIWVGGERAGRMIVRRSDEEILIVDIVLLPEFRGAGIGSALVRRLLAEADAGRLPVRCHVLQGSDARRFWERAGFVAQDGDGDEVYVAMERPCETLPP
jgi:GNAT superfamily N-acetyltransferase